jgi:hypothetical protein
MMSMADFSAIPALTLKNRRHRRHRATSPTSEQKAETLKKKARRNWRDIEFLNFGNDNFLIRVHPRKSAVKS